MDRRIRWIAGTAIAVAVVGAGTGVGVAASNGDERPLTGSALDRATSAALAHVGGGTVIESEAGDGAAAYGVEIRLDDGSAVEVNIDANFQVIGQEADDDGPGGDAGPNDD